MTAFEMAANGKTDSIIELAKQHCKLWVENNTMHGLCEVPTAHGVMRFNAQVPIRPIKRALINTLQEQSGEVGWGWSDIKKAAKKVGGAAKKIASKKTLRAIGNALNDPRVKSAMTAASTVVPGLGVAYQSATVASNLVDGAMKGKPSAIAALAQVTVDAQTNEKAKQILDASKGFYAARKLDLASRASSMLDAARSGDRNAQVNLIKIKSLAMSGDTKAKNIVELMREMYSSKKYYPVNGAGILSLRVQAMAA